MKKMYFDDLKFKRPRKRLIEQLREKGIESEQVLEAIDRVPRHELIDSAFHRRAYEDSALPILLGQTISQPFTVARQTELLEISPNDKILEIGTGSGYQAMILSELGAQVYTIERHSGLYESSRNNFRRLGYKRIQQKLGDGTQGWSAYSPYTGIIVTAGAPVVPVELIDQLEIGGRLVIPVGDQETQKMLRCTKISPSEIREEAFNNFKFVPLIGIKGWDK